VTKLQQVSSDGLTRTRRTTTRNDISYSSGLILYRPLLYTFWF